MRIIGGNLRGTKLFSLEGDNTRPTLDRVKESLFNIIQMNIVNSIFLDLFSGSGAIGLEAISRGAKKVVLCDNAKDAIQIIKSNIEKTKTEDKVKVYNLESNKLLEKLENEKFDHIYIDPPYENVDIVYNSVLKILEKDLLAEEGIIIIETDKKEKIIEKIKELNIGITDTRKYGRICLIFAKKR